MLVITRKENEVTEIYTPTGVVIKIMVVEIGRGQIKLGIDAPYEYNIVRDNAKNRTPHGHKV